MSIASGFLDTPFSAAARSTVSLCVSTSLAMVLMSSGVTYFLPSRRAFARAQWRSCTIALGLAPSTSEPSFRVASAIRARYASMSSETVTSSTSLIAASSSAAVTTVFTSFRSMLERFLLRMFASTSLLG